MLAGIEMLAGQGIYLAQIHAFFSRFCFKALSHTLAKLLKSGLESL